MTTSTDTPADSGDERPGNSPADPERPPEADEPPSAGAADAVDADLSVRLDLAVTAPIDTAWLAGRLRAALPHLRRPVVRVDVLIVDDDRMIQLHRRHLDVPATTDVLTFPASRADDAVDVDIALCADVAARQAKRRDHRIEHELLLYALHGLLHCAGFDDHDEPRFEAMHAEEDRILLAIGVGETFRGGRDQPNERDEGRGREQMR